MISQTYLSMEEVQAAVRGRGGREELFQLKPKEMTVITKMNGNNNKQNEACKMKMGGNLYGVLLPCIWFLRERREAALQGSSLLSL